MAKYKQFKPSEVVPGALCIVNPRIDNPTLFRVRSCKGVTVELEYEAEPGRWVIGGMVVDYSMLHHPAK